MLQRISKAKHDTTVITKFLHDVWAYHEEDSYVCICARRSTDKRFYTHPVRPHDERRIQKIVSGFDDYDLYFTPNSFSEQKRRRQYALPTRYAWCDLDGGDPDRLPICPQALWMTSPGRYQALWRWEKVEAVADAEAYSKAFAQFSEDGTGWEITKLLRVPGSINNKPEYGAPRVTLVRPFAGKSIAERPTPARVPKLRPVCLADVGDDGIDFDNLPDYRAVQRKYPKAKNRYGMSIRSYMGPAAQGKRSSTVAAIAIAYAKEGAAPDEIASVVMASKAFQSKWGDSRRDAAREVAKGIALAHENARQG
jgi:hypothetical protein